MTPFQRLALELWRRDAVTHGFTLSRRCERYHPEKPASGHAIFSWL
jgi:hypothetical protein